MKKAEETLRKYPAAYMAFAVFTVILIIRGFYGFCQSDESFYTSTASRFAAGDLIFVDEWHPTQLSSLVTMPFYWLYTRLTGQAEGVLLYIRVLYVLLTALEAAACYRIIAGKDAGSAPAGRKYACIPAFALGLFLMFYCHLNMPSLSYYTLSFNFFVFAFILAYAGLNRGSEGSGGAFFVTGGAVFALAVLCLPTLVVAALAAMLILALLSVRMAAIRRPLIMFSAGIMIPLVLFIIYLYASGNSIAGLLANLTYIMSDEEHNRGYVESFKVFFRAISDVFGRIYYLSIMMVILAIASYVNLVVHKWIRHCILYTDLLLFIYYAIVASGCSGFMNTAFALFVFPIFFLTRRRDWYVFLSLFMGGLVYSMTCAFSSYCDLYVLSVGHGIAAAGSILLLWDFITEFMKEDVGEEKDTGEAETPVSALVRRILTCAMMLAAACFLLMTMIVRFRNVYRDDRIGRLDARITAGPAAGLYTSSEHKAQYDSVLGSIRKYSLLEEENAVQRKNRGRVLFSKLLPWGYMAVDMRVAAPDTWRNTIDSARLAQYYETHEMPDLVFVLNADVGAYEASGDVEADPIVNLNEFSGKFAEILQSDYDAHIEKDCTVFVRKR